MRIRPVSQTGKWAVYLIIGMFGLYLIGFSSVARYSNVPASNGLVADLSARPLIAIPMLTGILSGVLAFVFSLVALIKHRERSLLVYLATLIGALLVILLVGELFTTE